jgi:hypothetical protein
MQLVKFASINNSTQSKLNQRILTPDSIPMFVLPPKLDKCHRSSVENCTWNSTRKFLHRSTAEIKPLYIITGVLLCLVMKDIESKTRNSLDQNSGKTSLNSLCNENSPKDRKLVTSASANKISSRIFDRKQSPTIDESEDRRHSYQTNRSSKNELNQTFYDSLRSMIKDNKRSKSETLLNLPFGVSEMLENQSKKTNPAMNSMNSSTCTLNKAYDESKNCLVPKDVRAPLQTAKLADQIGTDKDMFLMRSMSTNFQKENVIIEASESTDHLKPDNNIFGFLDIELKYDFDTELISMTFKNLNFKPLVEVNELKSKIFYYICHDAAADKHDPNDRTQIAGAKKSKEFFYVKNIKFDRNFKHSIKDIDFSLDEYARKMKKTTTFFSRCTMKSSLVLRHRLVIIFKIRSYIPISRRSLISTFRKKSRVFRGEIVLENINPLKSNFHFVQKKFTLFEH